MKKILGFVAGFVMCVGTAHAGTGHLGLSFGAGTGGNTLEGSASHLQLTYGLSDDARLAGGLAFGLAADETMSLGLDVGYRGYLNEGSARGFYQADLSFLIGDFDNVGPSLVLGLGGGLGVEYFFNDHVSLSGHTGLMLMFANEFNTVTVNTLQTGADVNVYW